MLLCFIFHINLQNMKPFIANLLTAVVLIGIGLWGYLENRATEGDAVSPTALIPVVGGAIFLLLTPGMKKENKVVAHIVVLLTLLLAIGFIKPLSSAIIDGDSMGMLRVGLMLVTCVVAMVIYIKSFIDARKAREAEAAK